MATSMRSPLYLALLCVGILIGPSLACSVIEGYKPVKWSMEDLFYSTPVAVVGKVTSLDEDTNLGELQLYCSMKWDRQEAVPSSILVHEAVFVSSCSSRASFVVGEVWLVALGRQTDGNFTFYEPDINNNAAYDATPENLQRVADICDMSVVDVLPPDVTFTCPVTAVTPENCYISGSVTILASALSTMATLLIYFAI